MHHKDFSVAAARLTRNDTVECRAFRALVILRIPSASLRINSATKNLVHGKQPIPNRRTRCSAPLSMTQRDGHPLHKDGAVLSIIPGITQSILNIN